MKILSTSLIALLTFVFVTVAVYVPQPVERLQPKVALAQLPTFDLMTWLASVRTSIESTISAYTGVAQLALTSRQWWWDTVIRPVGWHLAKAVISQIMRETIRWVNTGFQGSPAYIQDLGQFLVDVADEEAAAYLTSLWNGELSIICSPFRLDVQMAVSIAYQRGYKGQRRCTLSGMLQNLEGFIRGDVNAGGWPAWRSVVLNPSVYTPYGAGISATVGLHARIVNARGQQLTIGGWGAGFLSSRVCDPPRTVPGGGVAPQVCRIVTPGQVISSQINQTLQLGNESLVEADEINELIGAFMSQVALQALSGVRGLLGLGGNSRYKNPSFNIDMFQDELYGAVNINQAVQLLDESLRATKRYLDLAETTIDRYLDSYTNDPEVQKRADATFKEAAEKVLELEKIALALEEVSLALQDAKTDEQRVTILKDLAAKAAELPSDDEVETQAIRWSYGLEGMRLKSDGGSHRGTLMTALENEKSYLELTNAVIARYTNDQGGSSGAAYAEARELRPDIQNNVIDLQNLILDYDEATTRAEREAVLMEEYPEIKADLHTPNEVQAAADRWGIPLDSLSKKTNQTPLYSN